MKETFSNNLKKFRKEKQLSQEQLAELLGITTQAVSKWECSLSYPDIDLLPQLADLFGVSIDSLLRGDAADSSAAEDNTPFLQPDLPDDNVLRIVQYRGRALLRKDTYDPNIRIPLSLNYEEPTSNKLFRTNSDEIVTPIEIWSSADIVGDINGPVSTGNSVTCSGDINGPVSAGNSVTCSGGINGCASAGKSIDCSGDIAGPANAGQNISCGADICGYASAGKDISCGADICGSASAEGDITCNGDICENATADGNITCYGNICGSATADGNITCNGQISQ